MKIGQKRIICKICNEKNKQTRAYVNCTMYQGTICMEHCENCRYRYTSRGSTHCTYKEGGNNVTETSTSKP